MKTFIFDIEITINYFLVAWKDIGTGEILTHEIRDRDGTLCKQDIKEIGWILESNRICGFNSKSFDVPLLLYAISGGGTTCENIYRVCCQIIEDGKWWWEIYNIYNLKEPESMNHVDVRALSPSIESLKIHGTRLHSKTIKDLVFEPGSELSEEAMEACKKYCINDLDITHDLFNHVQEELALREMLSKRYNIDLLCAKDAKIAEKVMTAQLEGNLMDNPRSYKKGSHVRYDKAHFIEFKSEYLNKKLDIIRDLKYEIDKNGHVIKPKEFLKDSNMINPIMIGDMGYTLGIGGLHSTEKGDEDTNTCITPEDDEVILHLDVSSMYPSLILGLGLYPKHIGTPFLREYRKLVNERLKAKADGDMVKSNSLKIVINSIFGKMANKWSFFYAPELMLSITLTGQLALFMLVEALSPEFTGNHKIRVLSANTDGIVVFKPKSVSIKHIINRWMLQTGCKLDVTRLYGYYSQNVNNYLAITEDGYIGKGIFGKEGLDKAPKGFIIYDAVREYLTKGTPLETTIMNCKDIRKFVLAGKVAGGAKWRDEFLGKAVRWYWANDGETIHYVSNNNTVGDSHGAKPLMTLGDFPDDIDYERYVFRAENVLHDIGYDRSKIEEMENYL